MADLFSTPFKENEIQTRQYDLSAALTVFITVNHLIINRNFCGADVCDVCDVCDECDECIHH